MHRNSFARFPETLIQYVRVWHDSNVMWECVRVCVCVVIICAAVDSNPRRGKVLLKMCSSFQRKIKPTASQSVHGGSSYIVGETSNGMWDQRSPQGIANISCFLESKAFPGILMPAAHPRLYPGCASVTHALSLSLLRLFDYCGHHCFQYYIIYGHTGKPESAFYYFFVIQVSTHTTP